MTKKHNSIAKLIACIALAAVMVFSMALPALADEINYSVGSDADNPAKAVLTKIFKIPVNTTVPKVTFTFEIKPTGVNDGSDTTKMPALGNGGSVTVSFTLDQTPTFTKDGTYYLVDQTDDIIANLPKDGSAWKAGAGIYKYSVAENNSGITLSADPNDVEYTNYSPAVYDLEIWVEEDEDGVLFPMYIVGYYIEGTPDEYYPDTPGNGKLDPTPGDKIPGTPGEIGENYSEIIFTNRYWKTDGPLIENPDPDKNALEIKKVVTGNNPNLDTYFEFEVTVVTPEVVNDAGKYNAYIIGADGNYLELDGVANPNVKSGTSDKPAADYITFKSDVLTKVYLKHGDRLVFFDLEVGAEVRAHEKIVAKTRVKYTRTFSNPLSAEFNMPAGTAGKWGFPRDTHDAGPHYTKQGASANIATFFNNMNGEPPTGLSMDDLPYIVLIGVAGAGLAGFIVVKSRKRENNDA